MFAGDEVNKEESITYKIQVAKAVSEAYKLFKTESKDLSCFEVVIEQTKDELIISFLFKDGVRVINDKIQIKDMSSLGCGLAKSYFFKPSTGELVKQVYQK